MGDLAQPLNPGANQISAQVFGAESVLGGQEFEKELTKIIQFSNEIKKWDPNDNDSIQLSSMTSKMIIDKKNKLLICQQGKSLLLFSLENFSKDEMQIIDLNDEEYNIKVFKLMECENETLIFIAFGRSLKWYSLNTNESLAPEDRRIKRQVGSVNFPKNISSLAIIQKTIVCSLMNDNKIYYTTYFKANLDMKFSESSQDVPVKERESITSIIITDIHLILGGDKGSLIFQSYLTGRRSNLSYEFQNNFKREMDLLTRISSIEISKVTKMMLVVADSNIINVWNMNLNKFQSQLIGHTDKVKMVCFTNSGLKAISADSIYIIYIWNISLSSQLGKINNHLGAINKIIVTEDDKYFITCSGDQTIKFNDIESCTVEAELRGHKDKVLDIDFFGDKIYSTSKDGTIRKWKLAQQRMSLKREDKNNSALVNVDCKNNNIIVSTDSSIISYSFSKNIASSNTQKTYELEDYELNELAYNTEIVQNSEIKHISFFEDSQNLVYVKSDTNSLKFMRVDTLEEQENDDMNDEVFPEIIMMKVIHQEKILYLTKEMDLHLCNKDGTSLGTKKIQHDFGVVALFDIINTTNQDPQTQVTTEISNLVCINDSGVLLIVSIDHETNQISEPKVPEKSEFIQKAKAQNLLFLNKDNICITFQQVPIIYIFNLITGSLVGLQEHRKEIVKIIKVEKDYIIDQERSKNNFLISVSADSYLKAWVIKYPDPNSPQTVNNSEISEIYEFFTIIEHKQLVTALIDIPNSNLIATASVDGRVVLYNVTEKRIENIYNPHGSKILGLGILNPTPESILVVSYTKKSFHLWDINEYKSQTGIKVKGTHNGIEKFIALSKLKFGKEISLNQRFVTFGDYEFTYLHYYFFKNQYQLAEVALNKSALISLTQSKARDKEIQKSALFIAIKTNSVASIKVFIEYLKNLSLSRNTHHLRCICFCIRNDLIDLIDCGSSKLFDYFESIFFRVDEPKIVNEYDEANSLTFSDKFTITEQPMTQSSPTVDNQLEDILIENKSCMMLLPIEFGTKKSVDFLKALDRCKVQSVLKSSLIKSIIEYKWSTILNYLIIHSLMIWLVLVSIVFILMDFEIVIMSICIIFLVTILSIYELFQIINERADYFRDIWNLFDINVLIFDSIWAILILCGFDYKEGLFQWITLIAVFFSFVRGISCFRIIDGTRFYIQLILKSINDVGYFLIIYAYSTCSFAVMFMASGFSQQSEDGKVLSTPFLYYFKSSYDENIGGLDSDIDNSLFYIAFMVASIINVTIMLNLLISILGDTFDNFQMNAVEIDTKEKLQGIIEIEGSICLFKAVGALKYVHMCLRVEFDEEEEQWEGKIKTLEKKLDNMSKKISEESRKQVEMIREMETRNSELISNIFHKVDSLQDSIPNSIKQIIQSGNA